MKYDGLKTLTLLIGILQFILGGYMFSQYLNHRPQQPVIFICLWWVLSFITNIWSLKNFSIGYLISLFSFLVTFRIVSFYTPEIFLVFMTLLFFLYVLQFIYCVYPNNGF